MMIVLEFFAHNYSYSKQETMQLTIPEALFFYTQTIKREKLKALDEISKYEILLAIATNPHIKATEARKLPNEFKRIKMKMQDTKVKPQEVEKNLEHLKRLLGNK
jgi:3-dehydroquinate synthetase